MDIVRLPPWSPPRSWTRTAWVSAEAKAVWTPRIAAISKALSVMEIESVFKRERSSALLFKTPQELVDLSALAITHGCTVLPVGLEGDPGNGYSSNSTAYVPGKAFKFRTILTSSPEAWTKGALKDEMTIGALLGYPKCCSEFFKRVWVDEKWIDTTLPMAERGVEGPPEVNILLRWLGVRLVRHLPCSFNCQRSQEVAQDSIEFGRSLGFGTEMGWALEMLSWNVEWSSKGGVAIIRTPVFKVTANTDPLAVKVTLQRHGSVYPDEGATGLEFPYKAPNKLHLKVTDSKSFVAGIESSRAWKDNGFSTKEAMERGHNVLLELVPSADRWTNVLDLGCGNGLLLQKILEKNKTAIAYGVEADAVRASRAVKGVNVQHGNIADVDSWDTRDYDLVLVMPGRLSEAGLEKALQIRDAILKAKYIIAYTYNDQNTPKIGMDDVHQEMSRRGTDDGIEAILYGPINGLV